MSHAAYKSDQAREAALACYDHALTQWPVPYEGRIVTTSFGDTYILISGAAGNKPLVLLHGGGGNSTMWNFNVATLAKHFQVFAVDIIGEAGKSAGTRPSLESDDYARWLKEVFDALKIEKAAVCGLSLGGTIAHQFALRYPESVSSLILLAPPSLYKMNPFFILRAIFANVFPIPFFAKNFLTYMSTRGSQLSESEIQAFIIQVQAYKPNALKIPIISDQALNQLSAKTLILIGQDEVIYSAEKVAARIHAASPSMKVMIVPHAKHVISADQPDLVNAKIIEFIGNHP